MVSDVALAPQADAPRQLTELVGRFGQQLDAYKSGKYNEAQLRREFLDPLFETLGWDVANTAGYSEAYKDVVHEDAIKVGASTKAPDYCFRVGGTRKFFVEAKKPSVSIKDAPAPAFQLRRYAWSAGLPLSVLTDFEEFAAYDCRQRPCKTDKPATGRILYLRFDSFAERWSEIASVFSKQAVLHGSFDQFAESAKGKRGTEGVDDAFLGEIESWRDKLAKNIALRNRTLSLSDLNFAVQRTIDRIVFLRICEDRGIEGYGRLQTLADHAGVYPRLCDLFRRADSKYDSGLFHFGSESGRDEAADGLTLGLTIDDDVVRDIVRGLYYPDSPYEFSVLPADILGQVYERFLGKVIRLTADHHAKVEEKPEVRKAGGVYYTPTRVVEYVVQQTVGKLIEGKTPGQVAELRILDPACGSGSFLLGAYQRLLDWHRDWYVANDPEKWARGKAPALFQTVRGEWQLTTGKRKQILLNTIFGVDIDAQAVEVTKLSLLLKVLEGETEETLGKNLALFEDRALPDLGRNIRCGNSLVAPDFFDQQPVALAADTNAATNAFDWPGAFPEVFKRGGFDAVIGNPPYLSYGGRQAVEIPTELRDYFSRMYESAGWPTSHGLFTERSVRLLSRRYVSFIVPDQVGHLAGYQPVRDVMLKHGGLLEARYWGEHVFKGVITPALTFVVARQHSGQTLVVNLDGSEQTGEVKPADAWSFSRAKALLKKLSDRAMSIRPFIADCGIRTTKAKEQVVPLLAAKGKYVPTLEGKQIGRYWCAPPEVAVLLDTGNSVFVSAEDRYARARFVIRQTAAYPIVAPHEHTTYFRNSLHALFAPEGGIDVRYLVGLLNSKLLRFAYVQSVREASQRTFPQVKLGALAQLPIRAVDLSLPEEREKHDRIVELVEALLSKKRELRGEKNPNEVERLRRTASALDDQVDRAVYGLYGLSDDEVQEVEAFVATLVPPP